MMVSFVVALAAPGCAEEEEPAPLGELYDVCGDGSPLCVEPLECLGDPGDERTCNRSCTVDTVVFGDMIEQQPSEECPDATARYCYDRLCQGEFGDG